MAAKYKLGEDGKPVFVDGKLVLVQDDGTETPFDAIGVYKTLGTIRKERDDAQALAEAQSAKLKAFGASDEELEKAKERLKLARALDDKKLVDAGKVEEVVAERLKEHTAKTQEVIDALNGKLTAKDQLLRKTSISNRFATTKALDGYVLTPDLAEAVFGDRFDLDENGQLVAYRDPGKKERIYSASGDGSLASIDEALGVLLKAHPNHDKWKKSSNPNGSDAPGNRGGAGADALEQKSPEQRLAFGLAGGKAA